MDGTRAGRFPRRGDEGRDGGLCTPGSTTLDTFALTRTLTFADWVGLGMFSSGCKDSGDRPGEEPTLISERAGEIRRLEDTLPRRCRTNEACGGVPEVNARCRDSSNGEVELFPLGRAVSLALTAGPATGEELAIRECGGLKGDGARVGAELPRTDGGVDAT